MVNPINWLVTGACGFIGARLVERLVSDDGRHRVRVLDNLSVGSRDNLAQYTPVVDFPLDTDAGDFEAGAVQLALGDVRDAEAVRRATRGADVVVHLAANAGVAQSVADPIGDCATNVLGTLHGLEAARHHSVPRFVFASSVAPLGDIEPPAHEKLAPRPASPYGASKLAGEGYCSAFFHSFGIQTTALRFGNVYGPGSTHKTSVVAKFIRQGIDGEPLEIYGDGQQTRDFVFIDDLLRAIQVAVASPNVGGEIIQIATNRETTLREMTDTLQRVFQRAGIAAPEVVFGQPLPGEMRRNYADTSKAKRLLGWQAEVALEEGLEETVGWFLRRRVEAATR